MLIPIVYLLAGVTQRCSMFMSILIKVQVNIISPMPCDVIQCGDILNTVVVWSPQRLLELNKKTMLILQECQEAFCIANRVHVYVNKPELTRNETGAHDVHLELELIFRGTRSMPNSG